MAETKIWVAAAKIGDIEESDAIRFHHSEKIIAVFNLDGKFYATSDICTHAHAHLSEGYIDGDTVECPLHQGLFQITTGKCLSPPVTVPLQTYPTRVDGDTIFVELDA